MYLLTLLAFFWAPQNPSPPAEEAAFGEGSGWSARALDLEVVVLPDLGSLGVAGVMVLELENERSAGPSLAINRAEPGARFVNLDVLDAVEVQLNLPDAARGDTLLAHIRRDPPYVRGDTIEVGFEVECSGRSSQFVVDEEFAIASWVTVWHPMPRPRSDGERIASLLSVPGTTSFYLPPGWRSFSNGARTGLREEEGVVIETWEVTDPVARSFAAGPYRIGRHEVDGRSFAVGLLGRDPAEAEVQARSLADAIEAMEQRFGPYPYPSYGIVEVPASKVGFYGSSEQGFLMAASTAFEHGPNLPLFAHEASHGWWGNSVDSAGPGAILLSESLAQYGAVIAIEALEGELAATEFLRFSRKGYISLQCARGYFSIRRGGNDKPLIDLESGGWDHQLSDSKGNWMYHMLRHRVGDEVFFATLRGILERFAGRVLTVHELKRSFLAAAPDRDLERFFEQWLGWEGAPELQVEWTADETGARGVLRQVQEGEPYHLFVELDLVTAAGRVPRVVETEGAETPFVLNAGAAVIDVELDPRHRILRWTEDYAD